MQLQQVTICTGILNRSNNYLNYVIGSLQNARHKELIELSIFDCGSSDLPDFEQQVKQQWPGRVSFTTVQTNFSRSFTFNRAVEQASGKIIFLCDADMSIPEDIVEICNSLTGPKTAWFPIYFYLFKNKPANNWFNNWDTFTRTSYKATTLIDPYASDKDKKEFLAHVIWKLLRIHPFFDYNARVVRIFGELFLLKQ